MFRLEYIQLFSIISFLLFILMNLHSTLLLDPAFSGYSTILLFCVFFVFIVLGFQTRKKYFLQINGIIHLILAIGLLFASILPMINDLSTSNGIQKLNSHSILFIIYMLGILIFSSISASTCLLGRKIKSEYQIINQVNPLFLRIFPIYWKVAFVGLFVLIILDIIRVL